MTTIWIAYKRCCRWWMAKSIFLIKRLMKKKMFFLCRTNVWSRNSAKVLHMCTVFACISGKNFFQLCQLPYYKKWNLFIGTWHFGSRYFFLIILCFSSFLGINSVFLVFFLLPELFLYSGENCFQFLLRHFACVPDVDDYDFGIRASEHLANTQTTKFLNICSTNCVPNWLCFMNLLHIWRYSNNYWYWAFRVYFVFY